MNIPFENETSKVIKQLTKRSLQTEKRRNLMIVLAILLAAFLMSMCGTLLFAFNHSQNSMATFEVTYQDLTEDKIERLRQKSEIEMVGKTYYLGEGKTQQGDILKFSLMDESACRIAQKQFKLIEGTMPAASNEIAADQEFLEAFAPELGVGSPLMLPINGQRMEFIISAVTASPARAPGQYSFYVSEELIQSSPDFDPSAYQAYVHFRNADGISKDELKAMGAEIGTEIDAEFYYSYLYFKDQTELTIGNVFIFMSLGLLVLFSGIIVIQSVFQISVNEKIRSYGQLRTLGATRKQIRRIVKYESRRLSLIGIPFGLIAGGIAGNLMGSNRYASGFSLSGTILVSAVAAIFSLIMVELSICKPVKIAANTSPMEAVRFIPYQESAGRRLRIHRRINPLQLALLNLKRDRKRAVSTLLSLTLGGLLLFLSASAAVTYSPEQDVRAKLFVNGGDFRIYLSEKELTDQIKGGTPLNEALKEKILAIDGVKDVVPIRDTAGEFTYTTEHLGSDQGLCDIIAASQAREGQYDFVAQNLVEGRMPENRYEVLAIDLLLEVSELSRGDQLTITLNGNAVDVTIVGFYNCTYVGTENGNNAGDGPNLMITEELAHELIPGVDQFDYSWEIITEPSEDAGIQNELERLLAGADTELSLCTVRDEIEFMSSQMNLLFGGLRFLSLLIFLFGLVNLINMTLANQHSRKQEYSVLRAVGLTRTQLYQTMLLEGMLYLVFSTAVILIVGVPASILLSNTIEGLWGLPAMPYQFPAMYFGVYLLLLFALQLILSTWSIRKMSKYSLVDQLRADV